MKTDDLIDRLARDTAVVRPLPAPGTRATLWLIWTAVYLIVVAVMTFRMMSTGGAMMTPLYLLQQGAAFVAGVAAARAAFASVVPGASGRGWVLAASSAAAVWVGSLFWQAILDVQTLGTLGVNSVTDWPCVASMAFGAVILGGPLVWMLRRGAPLTPRATALFAGAAALGFANIEACLTRPHVFAMTVLLWHGGTILLIMGLFAGMGHRWLRWPSRPLREPASRP